MKTHFILICALLFLVLSSFDTDEACAYAGSNMGYVKTQTQKAIWATNVNESHFLAYRALNALVKSQQRFDDCGCDAVVDFMNDALDNLKMATRADSLGATRILLNRSLESTLGGLQAIEDHDQHGGAYGSEMLALNTIEKEEVAQPEEIIEGKKLKAKIDISLLSYEASLETVIETVDCKKAHAFATRIFKHCEEQLLREDLSEGKKYYNLRTKQITVAALKKLRDCEQ